MHTEFLEFLETSGTLDPEQVGRIRSLQDPIREPIGALAFSNGMLTNAQVDLILERQQDTGQLFGEIAREAGILKEQQLARLLEVQRLRLLWQTIDLLVLAGVSSTQSILGALQEFLTRQRAAAGTEIGQPGG